jgi:hypothetical protein
LRKDEQKKTIVLKEKKHILLMARTTAPTRNEESAKA